MPAAKFSLPHEREKARLKSQIIDHRVRIAEHKEKLAAKRAQLNAMAPKRPRT